MDFFSLFIAGAVIYGIYAVGKAALGSEGFMMGVVWCFGAIAQFIFGLMVIAGIALVLFIVYAMATSFAG